VGYTAHKRETRNAYTVLVGKPEGSERFDNPGIERKILK
jgi:hypothetical protein